MKKERLDLFLYHHQYCASRNKAQALIKNQKILVNNIVIDKVNYLVDENDEIKINEKVQYVSRGAYKLKAIIEHYNIDLNNKIVLDIGASTGGFSDYCLKNNAKKIYCVDVGANQLDASLKNNQKIVDLSPLNIKNLTSEIIKEEIDLIVSDLSFISSKYMFEAIHKLPLKKNIYIISLIKPQFELDQKIVSKHKGVIKDKKYYEIAIDKVKQYAKNYGFKNIGIIPSPIKGAKLNNTEFLGLFQYE